MVDGPMVDGPMVDGPMVDRPVVDKAGGAPGASAKPARSRGKSPTPAQGDLF
jgi:hypothetical protein